MSSKTGNDLFIVDNSDEDWKVLSYLAEWSEISNKFDIATGYFEIGALLALDGKWQKLDQIRILMGDEVTKRTHHATQPGYRYKPDGHELYDELIAKLFAKFGNFGLDRQITFAVRGNKPRTAVLKKVLDSIEQDFHSVFGFCPHGHTTVQSSIPSKSAGLQACDYLLWALQRFYERREERYLHALWPKFRRVLDLDAQVIKPKGLRHQEGVEFNEKHPLTLLNRAGV